jgi:hypothetical protein
MFLGTRVHNIQIICMFLGTYVHNIQIICMFLGTYVHNIQIICMFSAPFSAHCDPFRACMKSSNWRGHNLRISFTALTPSHRNEYFTRKDPFRLACRANPAFQRKIADSFFLRGEVRFDFGSKFICSKFLCSKNQFWKWFNKSKMCK